MKFRLDEVIDPDAADRTGCPTALRQNLLWMN
jgi:hypothetical protein